jgi:AraC family transcriptional regulator of adaptative response/methylated-DNA-[protein]-cysteine methyltransferase
MQMLPLTKAQSQNGGAALTIDYAVHDSAFGLMLVAQTEQGVCRMEFVDDMRAARHILTAHWPAATLRESEGSSDSVITALSDANPPLVLHIAGTDFQFDVWRALLTVAPGQSISYAQLAQQSGHPGAARAVGRAVGANPVALLIPCHRVIRQDGALGGYRWGVARKQALLAAESIS